VPCAAGSNPVGQREGQTGRVRSLFILPVIGSRHRHEARGEPDEGASRFLLCLECGCSNPDDAPILGSATHTRERADYHLWLMLPTGAVVHFQQDRL
jgi:hypothetical protein